MTVTLPTNFFMGYLTTMPVAQNTIVEILNEWRVLILNYAEETVVTKL
jgi:hypothetical protein